MVWKLFSGELQDAVKQKGFHKPTDIQTQGIPPILRGENTLLIAPTGLGKTESVILPVLDEWIRSKHKPISILYITPLKSLNRDLLKRILWWSEKLGFDVSVRHGDTSQYERSMQAANPADMFISTPETLQAMLTGKVMREHMKSIKWIVVDEIHEMVDNKRGIQLSIALERLKELIKKSGGKDPQMIGLSATIGTPEKVADFLTAGKPCKIVNTMQKRKIMLKVESPKHEKRDLEASEEIFIGPETSARLRRIDQLIREKNSVLAFTNTREFAEVLSSRLKFLDKNLPIETHHSSLSRDVRIEAEENFKKGKFKALICTSSLELGIDIGSIDLILQYMSPRQVAKLLQRVGRSGHKVTEIPNGVVISSDPDDCFESTVIANLALQSRLEPTDVYTKALDVLGHQIVGLSLEEYKIPVEKAYKIVKRAWPYKDLAKEDFLDVCRLMQKLGFIWVDEKFSEEPVIKRRKNSWLYYYQNLSTIPDVKNYKIIDIVSNKPVGTLDAEFIALHGSPGTPFICKGQTWKMIEIRPDKIIVEPAKGIEAAIPAWEGELIPVPFEVSQNVGALRSEIASLLKNGKKGDRDFAVDALIKKYPITRDVAEKMTDLISKQLKYGFVPDNNNILIEYHENYVIIHTCFGSMVNETLGRVLTTYLTSRLGSVGLRTDPYRIIIKLPGFQWRDVVSLFEELRPENLKVILDLSLPNTELFAWRFLHVAQRFGIVARNADYGKSYMKRIITSYSGSPPHREALNEIYKEKLDIEKTEDLVKMISSGKIKFTVKAGLSPLGELGLSRRYEIVAPERPEKEIFETFKKRLLDTKIRLVCCNCGKWSMSYRAGDVPENIVCSNCKAKLIGVIRPWDSESEQLIKKHVQGKELTKYEQKKVNEILDSASLIIAHGSDAAKALAGRGVGVKTASRLFSKSLSGDDLLMEILEAEKIFARTKRFWRS